MYRIFNDGDISGDIGIVTSGIWQDGASSLETFFSSSTQYANTGDYSVDVYRYNPSQNASASVQFGVAYGHRDGSGSLGTRGATGDRTTAAIFGQFNSLINPPETTTFTFQDNTTSKQAYAIVLNRARMREAIEPGGWELHLSASAQAAAGYSGSLVKLIDDSSINAGGNNFQRNFAPEYNIVSGTLIGGTTIKTAASAEGTDGSYGTFYPALGILLLNPERLSSIGPNTGNGTDIGSLGLITSSGSNSDDRNNRDLFFAIRDGGYFQMRRKEEISSTHYFVRATSQQFNATTNETYYTESVAGTKQVIAGLNSDPKTYITSVGLYNNDSELLAIAKLSQPILKSTSREALIKVKLDF
tara:strand:+ start:1762 stop:2835 length:1074 start_codon:yes stop_codon:yes gene_type:complete